MKPHRCHDCGHRPRRVISSTAKRRGGVLAEPRQHKKPCDCKCHAAHVGQLVEAKAVPS